MTTTSNLERPGTTGRPDIMDGPGMPVRAIKGIVLVLCCVVVIVPFIGVISTSIASQAHVTNSGGFVLWPDGIQENGSGPGDLGEVSRPDSAGRRVQRSMSGGSRNG